MVSIANPIYDVVFKYLMDDSKVAKLLLSAIIGEEIVDLQFRPQEYLSDFSVDEVVEDKPAEKGVKLAVYRLDFSARIKTPDGEKLVLIELQKVRLLTDIGRFRRYLGNQYASPSDLLLKQLPSGVNRTVGLPIVTIYILGEELLGLKGYPVLYVDNRLYDRHTGEQIHVREDFVESLTHRMYIISVPSLSDRRRDELEQILSIFDQSYRDDSHHILNIQDEDFPPSHRPLIRRLQMAIADSSIRTRMQTEDDIMSELELWEMELGLRDLALQEKDKALAEKDGALAEKDGALAEKEAQLAKIIEEEKILVRKLFEQGLSLSKIAEILGKNEAELASWLDR